MYYHTYLYLEIYYMSLKNYEIVEEGKGSAAPVPDRHNSAQCSKSVAADLFNDREAI